MTEKDGRRRLAHNTVQKNLISPLMLCILSVVACAYENDVDICESPSANALFPNGCDTSSNNSADAANRQATCNCRGKKLYWTSPKHPDVGSKATNSSSSAARTVTLLYICFIAIFMFSPHSSSSILYQNFKEILYCTPEFSRCCYL